MRRAAFLSILIAASLACSTLLPGSGPAEVVPVNTGPYQGMNLEGLAAFAATYEIRFEGAYSWAYLLVTRSDGQLLEYGLHLEGVGPPYNLGDVRTVSDGRTTWMKGPGTEDQCYQFPSDVGDQGNSYLTPDDLLHPAFLSNALVLVGEEPLLGMQATHYSIAGGQLAGWRDVIADVWLANDNQATLRYQIQASGPDPLFDAGDGRLTAEFKVTEVAAQEIQLIAGCNAQVPLPPSARRIVIFPGLVAFQSDKSAEKIIAFFQDALPQDGWSEVEPPQAGEEAILLTYQRGAESLIINIEYRAEGVEVQLIFE